MSYDHWKSTNPADEFLGPEPDDGPDEQERGCWFCARPIHEAMGFVVIRDVVNPKPFFARRSRELCQACADKLSEFVSDHPVEIVTAERDIEIASEMIEAAASYAEIHLEGLTIVRIDTKRLAEGMLRAAFIAPGNGALSCRT